MEFATNMPAVGLQVKPIKFSAYNRTGSATAIGQVVQLDLGQTATETTNNLVGDAASGFSNFIAVAAAGYASTAAEGRILAVCQEVAADNALCELVVSGPTKALVVNGNGDIGHVLVSIAAGTTLDAAQATDELTHGILLADPGADTSTLVDVLFNGEGTLGNVS